MSVQSTARFALVCLVFALFYHFTAIVTVIWLGLPILSSLLNAYYPKPVSAYDELKSAFDDIFEDIEHLPAPAPSLSYRELQAWFKQEFTTEERAIAGIKLNASKKQLEEWYQLHNQ